LIRAKENFTSTYVEAGIYLYINGSLLSPLSDKTLATHSTNPKERFMFCVLGAKSEFVVPVVIVVVVAIPNTQVLLVVVKRSPTNNTSGFLSANPFNHKLR